MKLSAILILVTSLHVAARSTAQRVTYSGKQVELPKVLSAIREQTGYVCFYDKKYLEGLDRVNVSLKDVPVEEALTIILRDLPLDFVIQGNTVFIRRKEVAPAPAPAEAAPVIAGDTIKGTVRDSSGAPLQGASVFVKGSRRGTKTDQGGNFALAHIRGGSTLVISYTGYNDAQIVLSDETMKLLFIFLERSQDPLDATVVQAYGTTSRRYSVGSIATINAETIEKQPVPNVLLALAGQAPGLAVTATSGVPGSKVLLQIRGQNTMQSNLYDSKPYDQPLFIIDGVPFAPQNNNVSQLGSLALNQTTTGGISTNGGISPFNNINPHDIESISVLKDADATSIYGTQGSNGVILITTKKGKPGKASFNLTANTGFNTAARQIKLLNTQQYIQLRKDAYAADGRVPSNDPFSDSYAPDLTIFDQDKYTDWQKVINGKTSNNTDIHASFAGGNFNNTFLLSAGYTRSNFNFPGNSYDQRFSLHSALHHTSQDGHLTVDFGTDYSYDQNNSSAFGGSQKILLSPNTPDLKDSAGNLAWNYKGVDLTSYQFYSYLKQPTMLQNYNLNNTLRIAYRMLPGLVVSVNMGYSRNTSSERSEYPGTAQAPMYIDRSASFAASTFQTINIEPQIDYSYTIGKGVLTALAGASYKKNTSNSDLVMAYGYANDNFLGSVNGAASVYNHQTFDLYKYNAGFARLKYIYDRKYIISLTGRRDGSSSFGPGNQFGNFGSAGAGWIFSEEKAVRDHWSFLSYGKLSGNYGTSGSDGIAAYRYQAFWQPGDNTPSFQGVQPGFPLNLYNPNYSWALKKSLNIALDLGFFHDRLLLNATFYRNREGNQLGGYSLPAQVGFTSVLQNLPATIQNQGWEFNITSSNVKGSAFSWTTSFNIGFNRNKLLAFPDLEGSPYRMTYALGKPISAIYGYRFKGVNPATGNFEFYANDGHATTMPVYGLPSEGGDMSIIGNREVRYMGGLGNTFTYKRFSLYLFFQFSSQMAPNYQSFLYGSNYPGITIGNVPVEALNHWKQPGDRSGLARLTSDYSSETFQSYTNFSSSTGAYSDDTYLRLKTASFSWSLPESWLKRVHAQDARIYVSAQNLLTVTNYKVADPEQFSDYTTFPLQRTVAFGINLNF